MPANQQDSRLQIRPFAPTDEAAVINLWQICGLTRPWNDPRRDIARKLTEQAELFLIGTAGSSRAESGANDSETIVATAMAGFDGHRSWVYYVAVDPKHQSQGYGRQIMMRIEQVLTDRGCPKLNLQVREDNLAAIAFWESVGYQTDAVVSLGKRLTSDDRA